MKLGDGYCHCGRPLHYSSPELAAHMHQLVTALGEFVTVEGGGVKYRVQRHYIALHGISGGKLAALGFQVIRLAKA